VSTYRKKFLIATPSTEISEFVSALIPTVNELAL